ncbi:MAG: helix-turn-helix domain-containing protein [Sphingomonadaceae bacterium]
MTRGRAFEVVPSELAGERAAAVQAVEIAVADLAQAFARLLTIEVSVGLSAALQSARPRDPQPEVSSGGGANLNVEAAMQFLGISRDSLYQLIKSNAVKSIKIGGRRFFRPSDLEAYRDSRVQARWERDHQT